MLTDAGHTVGRVLAGVCTTLNPARVVVGGSLGASPTLVAAIRDGVDRYAHPEAAASCEVVSGKFGGRAELIGSLALAISRAAESPDAGRPISRIVVGKQRNPPAMTLVVCRRVSRAVEQPGRAHGRAGLRDPGGQQPVGGHDGDVVPGVGGPVGLPDDLGVAVLRGVDDGHVAVAAGADAAPSPRPRAPARCRRRGRRSPAARAAAGPHRRGPSTTRRARAPTTFAPSTTQELTAVT